MSKRLWKGLLLERLRRPVSLFTFSALVSIGTLLLYNIPFFSYVADNSNEDAWGRVVLQASLVVIMLVLNFMMTYLVMFLLRKVGRVLLALLALINATAVYFILTYHVMMDATTIGNVFNTRYSEASGFFSASLWLFILVFGVLPAFYCLFQPVVYGKARRMGISCADKYPQTFEVYKPVARNVEEGEKHVDRLVNAYDNTIRYTDYLLDSLVSTLRSMTDWHSAMMFISDHGESLGENNIFMHGLPMKLAPKVQYEIPFLVWTSDGFRRYKAGLPPVLEQHYVFHSVLNLLSIQSPAYDESFDIFER